MQLSSEVQIRDGLLAENTPLSEKPRLGFERTETTVHQASIRLNYLNGNRVGSTLRWNVRQVSLMAQQQSTNSATTTVTLNSRAADIPGGQVLHDVGINHEWISTPDGVSVGMGTAKGVPQSDAPGVKTQVVDHTGEVPTSTETFTGVNKAALATYTQVGTPTGRWIPGVNDCNTWAHNAINQSTPHDISIVIYGVPTVIAHNAVVYADGSIH